MENKQLALELGGYEHHIVMGYLDDTLFSKITNKLSFQEIENLIGKWDDLQGNIYQGSLLNADFATFQQEDEGYGFLLYDVQNWTPVCSPDTIDADKENLKRVEALTPIKSSKIQLSHLLRDVPYYPQNPESRYIVVFIETKAVFMGSCIINTQKYDADKVVFAQADFQTLADLELNKDEPTFNFLAGVLYDGEIISVDETEYESEPFTFDMWVFDTHTSKKVFTGNFIRDVSFADRLGILTGQAHSFADKIYEEERTRTNPRIIRKRQKPSLD